MFLGRGCSVRLGTMTHSAARCHLSGQHWSFHPSPERPLGWRVHRVARRWVLSPWGRHWAVTSPHSRQQEPSWGRQSLPPRSPAAHACNGESSVTGIPRPFRSFQESAETEGKLITGVGRHHRAQHTYIFILQQQQDTTPTTTSNGSPAGEKRRPMSIFPAQTKRLHEEPNTICQRSQGALPTLARNLGAASFPVWKHHPRLQPQGRLLS